MKKAKSRLPKKGHSNVKVFIYGFLLGSYLGVTGYLYVNNLQLRDLHRSDERPNSCQEYMCTELPAKPVEQSLTIVKKVQATSVKPSSDTQKRVYDLITEVWGVDSDFGHRLAFCESTYGVNVSNTQSSARGIFQFLSGTWIEQRNHDGDDPALNARLLERENIRTAYNHYKRMGSRPWLASQHCWR